VSAELALLLPLAGQAGNTFVATACLFPDDTGAIRLC